MPLDIAELNRLKIPDVVQALTKRDTMLYALGVGLGHDPTDENQLKFVYEKDLVALPVMAIVLASPGSVSQYPQLKITRTHVLHGEQGFRLERPIPVEGTIVGESRVTKALDKGKDKGAVVYTECVLKDQSSGARIGVSTSASFCRADGGYGGPSGPADPLQEIPDRAADASCDLPTFPNAALVYRLSGDYNPLHAEPAFAKSGGFDRPILHGRCTYAVACHALVKTICGYDPSKLAGMHARFSSVVYPGETIRTEIWKLDARSAAFRATIPARGNAVVLNNGRAEFA
jgi:acyl dehydratase